MAVDGPLESGAAAVLNVAAASKPERWSAVQVHALVLDQFLSRLALVKLLAPGRLAIGQIAVQSVV